MWGGRDTRVLEEMKENPQGKPSSSLVARAKKCLSRSTLDSTLMAQVLDLITSFSFSFIG